MKESFGEGDNLVQELSDDQMLDPLKMVSSPGKDVDSSDSNNSRKRRMESEGSNDDDDVSVTPKSPSSSEEDTKCTYGLKSEYLKSLGIKPPINKWVSVRKFRCDKSELKEVLELAGHVVTCAVFVKTGKSAKVMYSHPLEAVQAVSMLNGQIFYGQKLNVTMLNCSSDSLILPKGLSNIGPGLGIYGKPLRDVAKQYAKFVKRKLSLIDDKLFLNADDIKEENQQIIDEYTPVASTSSKYPFDRHFKISNVEDWPDDKSNTESKMKKAKRSSDSSDQDSDGQWAKQSSESCDPKPSHTITVRRDMTSKPDTDQTVNLNPIPEVAKPMSFMDARAQSFRPSVPYSNPQMAANPRMGMGPTGTMMVPQGGPVGPYGPPVRPVGPPVGPVGPQIGPVVPQIGPVGAAGPIVPPMGHPSGSVGPARPPGPFPPQVPAGPFQLPGQMPNPNIGPHPIMDVSGQPITLQFRNLPPTTTFPLLCEKVSQCGQVLSLQLTTPGCAVAQFAHRAHADRCFQVFNGKYIDGHMIGVRYA